jgi:hypothetical protein
MKQVQTILAKAALLSVLGIGLSACVEAVPEPVPAPGPVAAAPAPDSVAAVPAPAEQGPESGYYYGAPDYDPCCAVFPNIGLDFGFHGGHGFHR